MYAAEYLARIGFDSLVGARTQPRDEDDPASEREAEAIDHRRVADMLRAASVPKDDSHGNVTWLKRITWPSRMPGLKTWAGNQTLAKVIYARVKLLGSQPIDDLLTFGAPMKGASGIDGLTCPDAIDIGFSPHDLGMEVMSRPGLELLAIVGLESVPLVSWDLRVCGFLHDGRVWQFDVETRSGGYYHRWGTLKDVTAPNLSPTLGAGMDPIESTPDIDRAFEIALEALNNPPKLDAEGRYVDGVYAGMTPAEVLADRELFRRCMPSD